MICTSLERTRLKLEEKVDPESILRVSLSMALIIYHNLYIIFIRIFGRRSVSEFQGRTNRNPVDCFLRVPRTDLTEFRVRPFLFLYGLIFL